jgi:peptidoglycan/LPS O-acetylase OafA/YrhL
VPELDGLRGLAIALVVIWHYIFDLYRHGREPVSALLASGFLTWSGVDLFFVLSGFLIGGVLLRQRGAENTLRVFWVRRALRIFPLYYLTVLVIWFATSSSGSAARGYIPLWSLLTHTVNLMQWHHHNLAGPFGGLWSLSLEEQFYLLAPFVLLFASRRTIVATCFAAVALAMVLRLTVFDEWPAYYVMLPCRIDALAVGVLLAHFHESGALKRFFRPSRYALALGVGWGTLLLISPWWQQWSVVMRSFGYPLLAVCYGLLIIGPLLMPENRAFAVLRSRPLCILGKISYCVYLIHGMVLVTLFGLSGRKVGLHALADIALVSVSLVVTLVMGWLSWRYFEKPLLDWAHHFHYQTRSHTEIRQSSPAASRERNAMF